MERFNTHLKCVTAHVLPVCMLLICNTFLPSTVTLHSAGRHNASMQSLLHGTPEMLSLNLEVVLTVAEQELCELQHERGVSHVALDGVVHGFIHTDCKVILPVTNLPYTTYTTKNMSNILFYNVVTYKMLLFPSCSTVIYKMFLFPSCSTVIYKMLLFPSCSTVIYKMLLFPSCSTVI